ncbi:MAG: pirin family protein [Chromatiales bacterium]|nr:pirin family protein [Chromatiales bacterium]
MKKLTFIKRGSGRHWVGDGFPVRSIFSYHDLAETISPFLLMDYAGPTHFAPTARRRGVGAHPHRGFETVTIVYAGEVAHRDSTGTAGTIGPGDVQWMTAGSGILHEEFHGPDYARQGGPFEMIQLWANLPAQHKMTAPSHQELAREQIPTLAFPEGVGTARIIAGAYGATQGAARTFSPMNVWDLRLNAGKTLSVELPPEHTTSLFVLNGAILVDGQRVTAGELAVMERAGSMLAFDIEEDSTVLLLSGMPLGEPVVGHGPFVMNTHDQIAEAFRDFSAGRFGELPPAS